MVDRQSLNWALLLPLLTAAALLQTAVPLARIGTSYRAVDQGMSLASIGFLSSAFALLPVFFAVRIGRYSDRKGEARVAVAGACMVMLATCGLWLLPPLFEVMLALTLLLGVGQVMTISALQMATTRCSSPEARDRVLGHFLIATALGHTVGPLILAAVTPTGAISPGAALFPVLAGLATLMALAATCLAVRLPPPAAVLPDQKPVPLRAILATPGMIGTIVASGICLATNDLIVVFLPAMASERGIDAATVGLLLSIRAGASMASRLVFSRLVQRLGRVRLMTLALAAAGMVSLALFLPMPIWVLAIILALAGLAMGMAIACTISATIVLATPTTRATALSMRLTANRLGQFLLPLGAGAAAASLGAASPFVVTGGCLLLCALLVRTIRL